MNRSTHISILQIFFVSYFAFCAHADTATKVWGDITSLDNKKITLDQACGRNGETSSVTIEAASNTVFEGIKNPKELVAGDFIIVEYRLGDNGRAVAEKIVAAGRLEKGRIGQQRSGKSIAEELEDIKNDVKQIKQRLNME